MLPPQRHFCTFYSWQVKFDKARIEAKKHAQLLYFIVNQMKIDGKMSSICDPRSVVFWIATMNAISCRQQKWEKKHEGMKVKIKPKNI